MECLLQVLYHVHLLSEFVLVVSQEYFPLGLHDAVEYLQHPLLYELLTGLVGPHGGDHEVIVHLFYGPLHPVHLGLTHSLLYLFKYMSFLRQPVLSHQQQRALDSLYGQQ